MKEEEKCNICGGDYRENYAEGEHLSKILELHLCFTCAFWSLKVENPPAIIIDGVGYSLGSGKQGGMGGRRFDIKKNDGETITTNDLWTCGIIPERWREKLKDNAEFINGAKMVKVGDGYAFDCSR